MKGVMVVYIVVVMFLTIAEGEGFHGMEYSGVNSTVVQGEIENVSYQYTNSTGILEPIRATTGFLNTYLSIVANGMVFKFMITGAPAVVNYVIRTVFFVLSWIAFYEVITLMLSILAGVVSRIL